MVITASKWEGDFEAESNHGFEVGEIVVVKDTNRGGNGWPECEGDECSTYYVSNKDAIKIGTL